MKILVVSDVPDAKYWDYYQEGDLADYDLILSAGDLPPQYLSFLVTFAQCPLLYVHGNHDDCYKDTPPLGCECIDGKIVNFRGVRIMGLGGSIRYKPGINQYTEEEMAARIRKMRHQIRRKKGVDILLTHSPALGLGDGDDHVHKGFECFLDLLSEARPKYYFFGHQHLNYNRNARRIFEHGDVTLVNATKSIPMELDLEMEPDGPVKVRHHFY